MEAIKLKWGGEFPVSQELNGNCVRGNDVSFEHETDSWPGPALQNFSQAL